MNGRIGLLSITIAGILSTTIFGCSTTGKGAYSEEPNRLAASAPTAQQIEAPLNGHSTPIPAAKKNKNPLVEESLIMPTTDLHGGAFPGLNDLPEKAITVQTANIEAEELNKRLEMEAQKRRTLEDQLTQNQAKLNALEQQLEEVKQIPAQQVIEPDTAITDSLTQRLAQIEQQINSINVKKPQTIDSTTHERLIEIEKQLNQFQNTPAPPQETQLNADLLSTKLDNINLTIEQIQSRLDSQNTEALLEKMPSTTNFNGDLRTTDMFGTYQIGAGDTLEFQSFNDENLSRELIVKYDGSISLPLIPDLNVLELTREDAEMIIRDAYIKVFRDPQISLLVRDTGSKTFTVVGDIQTPGIYPYTQATRLIQAISLAGGLRNRNSSSSVGGFVGITGQLTKAFVIRHTGGQRQVAQYDLRGLGNPGAHAADVPILPGDLVYLPEGVNLVYLLGESRNPIIVELTEGMSMLQLLSMSGGFNSSTAQLRNVVLMRQVDEENTNIMKVNVREILKTGKDVKLQPGDVIYLPQKKLVRLEEFVRRFTGSISPVLQLYTNALDTYYAKDLIDAALEEPQVNNTLRVLDQLEQFGQSTQNIADLFGSP